MVTAAIWKIVKSNDSSNQSEKKVESNTMYNNRHIFEPGMPNSLGLSPGDFLLCSSCSTSTHLSTKFWGDLVSWVFFISWHTLLDLPSISTVSDNTKSADFTSSKDVQQHQ